MEPLSSPPSSNTGQQGGFGGQRGGFGGQRGNFGFGGMGGFNPMMGGYGGFGGFNPMMMGLGGMGGYGVFGGGFNPMMGFGFDRGNPMQQGIGSLGQYGGRMQPSQQGEPVAATGMAVGPQRTFSGPNALIDGMNAMMRDTEMRGGQPMGGGLQPLNLYKNPQEHQNALRQELGRNEIQRQLNEQFNRNRASGMSITDAARVQDELKNRLYTQYGIQRTDIISPS